MTRVSLASAVAAACALIISFALPSSAFATDFGGFGAPPATTWVSVNEFSSGSSADWIELYNASTSPIDLTGWKLEDLAHNTHTFTGTIAAGGFATTTFGSHLNNAGDEFFLLDSTGATSSDIAYGSATTTASAGATSLNFTPAAGESAYRTTDGGATWATTTNTTEGYSNIPCATVPPNATLAADATFNVATDTDSGNVGAWATDTFARHVQIWQEQDGTYCAKATDAGTFTSYGAPTGISPDSGASLPEVVTGSFTGYTYGTVTGGSFVDAGAPANLDCAGADSATCTAGTISYWVKHYFTSAATYNFGSGWSWTYDGGANGTWVDAASGTSGDIVHVQPSTVYVDPTTGSDSNYGDAAHPFKTVDAAMSAVADNGTVELVATSTAYSSITITRPLTLTSASTTDKAQIDGTVTIASDSAGVTNLDITNPSAGYGIIGTDVSDATVTGNSIHDIGTALTSGSAQAIAFVSNAANVTNLDIEHNTITNVGTTTMIGAGSAGSSAKGVYLGNSGGSDTFSDVKVSNNTISNIYASTATWVSHSLGGEGAYGLLVNHKTSNLTVSGNTISKLEGLWAHAIGLEGDTPNATVSNNTITGLTDHKSPSDSVALRLESNPDAATVSGSGNTYGSTPLVVGTNAVIVDSVVPAASGNTFPEQLLNGAYYYDGLNAFSTIASAVASAASGATMTVAAGTYPESVLVNKPLTIDATGATLTGTSTASYILEIASANGVTVNGLTIDGGAANAFTDGVLVSNAGTSASPVMLEHLTVKNVWGGSANGIDITAATAGGSYVLAHDLALSSFEKRGIRFTNSSGKFYDSEVTGDHVDGTTRVQNLVNLWGGSHVEIYGNTLHDGMSISAGTWDSPGIFVSSYGGSGDSVADIHDNTLYNEDTGIAVGSYYAASDNSSATIEHNTFHDDHAAINFEKGTATATVHDNSFGANITYAISADDGNGGPATKPTPDAAQNWWNSASGPSVASNPSGTGDAIYDGVSYTPWYADAGMTTLQWPTASTGDEASTTVSDDTTLSGSDDSVSVSAAIPAGTVVTGDANWDGTIEAPTATSTTLSLPGYATPTIASAVTIGSSKYDLIFSKPVELTFAGQAGKQVGFYDAAGAFAPITETCDGANTPTVSGHSLDTTSPGEACKATSGSDLVVWTTHFSTFVTYSATLAAPVMTPGTETFYGSVNVTMDDSAPGATIRYTTNSQDPTCGNGSGYANGQVLTFTQSTTLKAIRCDATGSSAVTTAAYGIATGVGSGSSGGSGGGGSVNASVPATPASPNGAGTPATPATPATPNNGNAHGEVLGAAAYNFAHDLHLGESGQDVTELQKFLIAEGFPISAGVTGYFGAQTKAAVEALQKAHGITPAAGYVGALTRAVLNQGVIATTPEHQTNLTTAEANAIIGLLQSFNADASVIANVKAALGI